MAARVELASFIIIIVCTLRAAVVREPASAGCRVAARGFLAGFIIIILAVPQLQMKRET